MVIGALQQEYPNSTRIHSSRSCRRVCAGRRLLPGSSRASFSCLRPRLCDQWIRFISPGRPSKALYLTMYLKRFTGRGRKWLRCVPQGQCRYENGHIARCLRHVPSSVSIATGSGADLAIRVARP